MRSGPGPLPVAGPRLEDERLIKGEGRFVANLEAPGALEAWFVRSPFANGALTGVDTSFAADSPGVVAIYIAADLDLPDQLQQERHLAYLFITHDLSVVRHMADRIVVMYVGKVAEAGPTDAIFNRPEHPYTEALLASSPDVDGEATDLEPLEGSIPDPALPPQGCRFHTRCPVATPECGWEVDDVVRWLEDGDTFDTLTAVTRSSPFAADLTFEDDDAAGRLEAALRSDAIPESMRSALEHLESQGSTTHIRFKEVPEVQLTVRGSGHEAACVLDRSSST